VGKTYDLLVKARGDTKDAERSLKQLQRHIGNTGKKMQSVGRMMTMGLTAPIVGLGVMGARELGAIEKATKQTDIALRRYGDGAKVSAKFVGSLAKALQQKSGIDDQAIQSGENLLLTLGGLDMKTKAGVDTFKVASRSMVEFADTMGVDVTSAGKLYAKTLAAASQGTIALPKGVKLTGDEMKRLKTSMDAAKTSTEKQSLVMDVLQKKFKGGMDLTNSEKLAVAMDNLAGVGAKLVTNLLPVLDRVVSGLSRATTWFEGLSEAGQKWVGIGALITAGLGPVLVGVGTLVTLFAGPLAAALAAITGPVALGVAAVVGLGVAFTMAYRKSESFRNGVNSVLRSVKTNFTQIFGSLRQTLSTWINWATTAWNKWGDDLIKAVKPAFNFVKAFVGTVLGNIASIIKTALALMRGDWGTAWNEFKSGVSKAWDGIKKIITTGVKAAGQAVKNLVSAVKGYASAMLEAGKALGKKIIDGIVDAIKAAAGRIKGAVKDAVGNIKIDIPKIDIPGIGGGKSRSGRGRGGQRSRGYVNELGEIIGSNPGMGSISNYFQMSNAQVYNSDGKTVTTNVGAKQFVEARRALSQKRLKGFLASREKAIRTVKRLDLSLRSLYKAKGKAKGKAKDTIAAKIQKVSDQRNEMLGLIEGYEQEIMSLGGSIQQDTEALTPPTIDVTDESTGGDTGSTSSTGSGVDAALSQVQSQYQSSQMNLQAANEAFGYFNGTGDIGFGGNTALGAARGGLNIYFSSTVPYTQEQARQVALMAAQGIASNGQLNNLNTNTIQIGA